ncbi:MULTISPECIES: cytochrome c [Sphingomonadales]|uniref:Aldehyde dehydrogenase n=2 Tax=Edaphosphingomonas TaxID=3423724 RepID=A0A2T4I6L7_9SPHN|nr:MULTISPECIES: cytochrome c [Sphingomonas]AGH48197.1 gluconate 2-dehydrogenase [Sphingomonas sp. MM-1]MDX3886248.1 cytochrome c [Sphingomonas sp.]OHT20654.1 Nicotinate dehydrogenase subunit B [Sphingomonas haloaromaticamans]PTD26278.1 aldehyde dehydrogenase [Sphingomonas fennica]
MLKRILIGIAAVLAVGLVGFGIFAWRSAIAPIQPPPASAFAPELVARGEILASAGYCATCHTAKGGQAYAGGYPMETPFGTIYSTNITPDPETGIGAWPEAAFRRAMHEGVARDGSHLFPAFPFDHFTKLSDADISALYAFFMTRKPVVAPARDNGVPFPLNIRALQAGWKLLFFKPGRFQPQAAKSAEWNRGAYLAEGLSHCGACHTPRNMLGAERRPLVYAGALIDNWVAPPLNAGNPSPVPWDRDELIAYLQSGVSHYHGTAVGPMAPVVRGLQRLPGSDINALAVYFSDRDGIEQRQGIAAPAVQQALATSSVGSGLTYDPAARLYTAACASCHYNGADAVNPLRPELALNSAVSLGDPTNLIQVILHGVGADDGVPGVVMPAFSRFSDADIARIAAYLRATRTRKGPWLDLERKVAQVRAHGPGQE